jgi:hypothetical protein
MVRAIHINPFECSVTEVEIDADDVNTVFALLSHETKPVTAFMRLQAGQLQPGEWFYVDDGADDRKEAPRFFLYPGSHKPLAGMGLIAGSGKRGEFQPATSSIVYAEVATFFLERSHLEGFIAVSEPWAPK